MAFNKTNKSEISNVLFNGVKNILRRRTTPWIGTMTDLNNSLIKNLMNSKDGIPVTWPASPSALRVVLNTVINRLRNASITVHFSRSSDQTRTRLVEFNNNR